LQSGKITFPEYAYNVTLIIVSVSDEYMHKCISTIPLNFGCQYTEYLRTFLEPVDFMPCPMPFLVGPVSEKDLEQAKQRLRPRYMRLDQLLVELNDEQRSQR